MGFSFRHTALRRPISHGGLGLGSQSGQGTLEYVLILVVTVAIILGSLYQLNTAFKSWANNYFGDYLACLLETGDLHTIGGSPGDSGVCEQFFKPYSLADGRPANARNKPEQKSDNGRTGGERERRTGPSGGNSNPVRYSSSGRFGGGWRASNSGSKGRNVAGSSKGGSTETTSYGGGDSYVQRPSSRMNKAKLDNKFAFQDEKDPSQKRKPIPIARKKESDDGRKPVIKLKPKSLTKKNVTDADTSFTVGNFIRVIIIAALLIALLMFVGGQVLSISKSME